MKTHELKSFIFLTLKENELPCTNYLHNSLGREVFNCLECC